MKYKLDKRTEHIYSVIQCCIGLYLFSDEFMDFFGVFFTAFSKIKNNKKIQAASKKEAGGDEKHVCFFTSPNSYTSILDCLCSVIHDSFIIILVSYERGQ